MERTFDLIIVGAGPAGFATAYSLRHSGLNIALLDKATFPREKVCGDGLTLDVVKQLTLLSPELRAAFEKFAAKKQSSGAEIWSPSHHHIILRINPSHSDRMATCRRIDFDHFLIKQLKPFGNITLFEACTPTKLTVDPDRVSITTNLGSFTAPMVVGADGVNSFIARQTGMKRISQEEQYITLRTYYRGMNPPRDGNPIEVFLLNEILPGYAWIFHLADGTANVGMGILGSHIRKRGIRLKPLFETLLQREPLKGRLSGGERLEPLKGLVIPLGGQIREISGDRFLLVGDAATLVDPTSGEGVGNAFRSGRIAASHISRCVEAGNFSGTFNKAYDEEIYRKMMGEFRLHLTVRKLMGHPWLINHVVGAAHKYPAIGQKLHRLLWKFDGGNMARKMQIATQALWLFTFGLLYQSMTGRPGDGDRSGKL